MVRHMEEGYLFVTARNNHYYYYYYHQYTTLQLYHNFVTTTIKATITRSITNINITVTTENNTR